MPGRSYGVLQEVLRGNVAHHPTTAFDRQREAGASTRSELLELFPCAHCGASRGYFSVRF